MSEDELLAIVNKYIGYQARVTVVKKPLPQPQSQANPFVNPSLRPKELWIPMHVKIELDTLAGPVLLGEGGTFDIAYSDAQHRSPRIWR